MLNFFIFVFFLIIIVYFVYIKQYFIINNCNIFFLTTILITLLTTLVFILLFTLLYYFFNFLIFYIIKRYFISFFFKLTNVVDLVSLNSFFYYLNLVKFKLNIDYKKIINSLIKLLINNLDCVYESKGKDFDNTFFYLNHVNRYWFLFAEKLYEELSNRKKFDKKRLEGVDCSSIRYNPNFNLINRLYINKINNQRWFSYTSIMEFNLYSKLHPTRQIIYASCMRHPSLLLKYYWKKNKIISITSLDVDNSWAKFWPNTLPMWRYDIDLLDSLTFSDYWWK